MAQKFIVSCPPFSLLRTRAGLCVVHRLCVVVCSVVMAQLTRSEGVARYLWSTHLKMNWQPKQSA